ncbi:putative P-loop containing nucleoside triphosphate hydrolase, of Roc (COR) [Helianthus annuus]|nr:putative P-loop containing nucleoside triphosphate hydrolase, of Roc (COR) [Helianthus annuus]KAJ0608602.1 putative P-loop containing nucleoside triphosphate hydrolase, of Roc (COR) [Helianthus annuus]
MASNQSLRDLQWLLQSIQTQSLNLKSISFHLSQPTSCCHQQTHDSIHINISTESHFQFSNILTLLSSCSNTRFSLQNLEFYRVEWDVEEVRNLEILLDNSSNVKRVEFKKNKLNFECMDGLAKILKKNNVIKEIVLSESRIGSYGACLIASALKVNTCLEELQIWEDSIGSKGAEEISKMIEANSTLKVLTIFDSSSITATPLISAVLARNRSMEVHVWSGEHGNDSSTKVVEFAPESSTLRIYRLTVSGACRVACALGWNTTVKSLDLTGVRLRSRWAKEFRWVLEQNRSLKEVYLTKTCLKNKGVVYVAAGLFKNRSLETLHLDDNRFNGVGVEHLLCPLTRFSTLQIQANITLKSITFGGKRTKIGRVGLIAILQMLSSNQTVTRLGIYEDQSLRPQDFIRIFKNLEGNVSLKCLSLQGCKGVDGDLVLKTIMETLQVNPWIEEIDIARTPLQICGKAEEIYLKLGQNAKSEHEPEVDLLKDMPMTVPKSCRIFICGQEFAGKTTLCNSISQNLSSPKLPYIDQVKTLVNPVEQAIKTTGMKVKTFKDEDTKLSIWNLGGHHELFSVHDLMFPGHGSASFFVVVSSLFRKPNNREPKSPSELEEDLQYWLRFIVSNSKRADQQCMLPNVTMVLTHHDKVDSTSLDFQHTVNAVQRVRDKFQGYVDFYPTVFTVDARSSASVSKLTHHIRKTSKTVLQRVPRVYELCNDLITILSDWRTENHDKPAMRWREFSELCQIRVPSLRVQSRSSHVVKRVEMRRKAVAACLHSIGEVIYFEELEFLILDFQWFCGEVIGQLVKLNARKTSSNEGVSGGFVSRKELEKILRGSLHSQIPGMGSKIFGNLDASDLVNMMLKLELCYKQDPSDPESLLLIPSLLEENRTRIPIWQLVTSDCVFAGRHLECHDSSHMFLTPGFFPKLQVQLHNKIIGLKSQHGATYSLEKHLILININGIHIRVELGGQLGYYIDILACSTKNLTETIKLFRELLYPPIQNLCPGLTLTENIIRPECVKNLTPPRYRKTQYVPLPYLKQALLSVPADSMYDYQHTWSPVSDSGRPVLGSGFDFARDLLSDDDFREVLHRRYHDLYNLAVELQVPTETDSDVNRPQQDESSKVDPSFTGIAKGVEEVIQRLKIIEMEIRDLKQEIQGLRYYEHRLLTELHRKVNYIANYNVQIEERKVPNMFYFVKTENYSRRLVTNMISGMTALRLHMLCEFRGEMHVVEDQMGCEMMQVDNRAVISLAPYMKGFMKLLTFALKIGAHIAAGMGEMIPDLSREVAHLAGNPLVYGAAGVAAAGAVGVAAAGGSSSRGRSTDIQQDMKAAQQWVVDFLRERGCSTGKDIAEKFGLWRVRYRDDGQIAWVCRRHMYTRANEIFEVPM